MSKRIARWKDKIEWMAAKRRGRVSVGDNTFEFDTKEEYSRYSQMLRKEPSTIEWIDEYVQPDDVFFDIGANVGVFSFYAARRARAVLSFEPHFGNYAIFNRNIERNRLAGVITAYCLAFSRENSLDKLFLFKFSSGSSTSQFARTIDHKNTSFDPAFSQGMLGLSLDYAVDLLPDSQFPNHIKIDVDGLEGEILQGGRKVLADPRLKTILVECLEEKDRIVELMEEAGLKVLRSDGVGSKGDQNVIFRRG